MSVVERIFKAINRGDRDGIEVAVATLEANPDVDIFSVVPGKGISILKRLWQIEAQLAAQYYDTPPSEPRFSEPIYDVLSKKQRKRFLDGFKAFSTDYMATKRIKETTPQYTAGNAILNLGPPINRSEPINTIADAGDAGPAPAPGPARLNLTNAAFPALGANGGPGGADPGPALSSIAGYTAERAQEEFLGISMKPTITSADIKRVFELTEVEGFWPSKIVPVSKTSGWHVLVIRERANKDSPILRPLLDYYENSLNRIPRWATPKLKREVFLQMAMSANDYENILKNPKGGYPFHSEFEQALPLVAPLLNQTLEERFATSDEFVKQVKGYIPKELLTSIPPKNLRTVFPIHLFRSTQATEVLDTTLRTCLEYILEDKPISDVCISPVRLSTGGVYSCEYILLTKGYVQTIRYLLESNKITSKFFSDLSTSIMLTTISIELLRDILPAFSLEQLTRAVESDPVESNRRNIVLNILQKYPSLAPILFEKGMDGLTPFLQHPVSASQPTTYNQCLLAVFAFQDTKETFDLLLENLKRDIDTPDPVGLPILFYVLRNDPSYAQAILDRGADPNRIVTINKVQFTPFSYIATVLSRTDPKREPLLLLFMTHPAFDIEENYRVLRQVSTSLPAGDTGQQRIKAALAILQKAIRDKQPYKGYSRSDLRQLNAVVEKPMDFSICPVCLSAVMRDKGCLYMSHDCSQTFFYHEELYQKYKDERGKITWCTLCSRISYTDYTPEGAYHYHLKLGPHSGPRTGASATVAGVPDSIDSACLRVGGGGVAEKYIRLHRMREYAYDLQDEVGKLSDYEARKQMVEELWNSPLVRNPRALKAKANLEAMLKGFINARTNTVSGGPPAAQYQLTPEEETQLNAVWSKYGVATTNFPETNLENTKRQAAQSALEEGALEAKARNFIVARPNGNNAGLQPIDHESGNCAVCLRDNLLVTQFRHRLPDSTVNAHEESHICRDCLLNTIQDRLKRRQNASAGFGKCPFYPECKATFYPQELEGRVPPDVYERYRIEFNKKVLEGTLKGGMRGGRQTQAQYGSGIPFLIPMQNNSATCTSANGVTPTPCSKCKTRRGGRRKQQRLKRTVRRR